MSMRQLKISKSITNRESQSLEKYLQEIGKVELKTPEEEVLEKEESKFIKFHWVDSPKDEFFEFTIEKSDVTNVTILVINDFAEKKEIKDQSQLWETQVKDLFYRLGN